MHHFQKIKKKLKRYLLDFLKKLHQKFLKTSLINEWKNDEWKWMHSKDFIKNIKTKQDRYVTKYKKEMYNLKPCDLIMQLKECDLPKLFQHERNIVHQYKTIRSLKESLTEKYAVIHMDFSENYTTKCNQEIQSYHSGGSRVKLLCIW